MTFKEKLMKEHPVNVNPNFTGGCFGCPFTYDYEQSGDGLCKGRNTSGPECGACWNREIPGTEPKLVNAYETRVLCKWPKENPHLTAHAKAKISEKIPLNPRDVEMLMANSQDFLGDVQKELSNAYDPQRFIYKTSLNSIYGAPKINMPGIKQVIFNDPATIVIWADGEKTVVKCQNGEPYDPEKGLAMAITKRALGNKGNYFDEIKKWTKEYKAKKAPVAGISEEEFVEGLKKLAKAAKIGRRG